MVRFAKNNLYKVGRVMLENIGKKFSQVGQEAIKKTQNLADVTALKSKINDEKKAINNFFEKIGIRYYEQFQDTCDDEELARFCAAIQAAQLRIEEHQEKIMQINGVKKCLHCGSEIDRNATFCSGCGNKVEVEVVNAKACSKCGTPAEGNDLFCTSCGNKLD